MKTCKCVFLVLIFKLNFHPFQCNLDFYFILNDKKTSFPTSITGFLNFENRLSIQGVRALERAGAQTSPHPVCVVLQSASDVKMEIPVLAQSLQSSILILTSFQMSKTFWGLVSAAIEQSRRKANMVAQGDGKFGP